MSESNNIEQILLQFKHLYEKAVTLKEKIQAGDEKILKEIEENKEKYIKVTDILIDWLSKKPGFKKVHYPVNLDKQSIKYDLGGIFSDYVYYYYDSYLSIGNPYFRIYNLEEMVENNSYDEERFRLLYYADELKQIDNLRTEIRKLANDRKNAIRYDKENTSFGYRFFCRKELKAKYAKYSNKIKELKKEFAFLKQKSVTKDNSFYEAFKSFCESYEYIYKFFKERESQLERYKNNISNLIDKNNKYIAEEMSQCYPIWKEAREVALVLINKNNLPELNKFLQNSDNNEELRKLGKMIVDTFVKNSRR